MPCYVVFPHRLGILPGVVGMRFAACWLVMRGDAYVLGALVSAHTWREAASTAILICMVTSDVSAHAREMLEIVFDHVREVAYISHPRCMRFASRKKRAMYDAWKEVGFTKWRCLGLHDICDVVLFMDADTILGPCEPCTTPCNVDSLFKLCPPAATFSSPWHAPWYKAAVRSNPFQTYTHGEEISRDALDQGYGTSFCIGTTVLLPVEAGLDETFASWLAKYPVFGWSECGSMLDEQALCAFFLGHRSEDRWTMIGPSYNAVPWHMTRWPGSEKGYVVHYFNTNPWQWTSGSPAWADLEPWFCAAKRWLLRYDHLSLSHANTLVPVLRRIIALWENQKQRLGRSFPSCLCGVQPQSSPLGNVPQHMASGLADDSVSHVNPPVCPPVSRDASSLWSCARNSRDAELVVRASSTFCNNGLQASGDALFEAFARQYASSSSVNCVVNTETLWSDLALTKCLASFVAASPSYPNPVTWARAALTSEHVEIGSTLLAQGVQGDVYSGIVRLFYHGGGRCPRSVNVVVKAGMLLNRMEVEGQAGQKLLVPKVSRSAARRTVAYIEAHLDQVPESIDFKKLIRVITAFQDSPRDELGKALATTNDAWVLSTLARGHYGAVVPSVLVEVFSLAALTMLRIHNVSPFYVPLFAASLIRQDRIPWQLTVGTISERVRKHVSFSAFLRSIDSKGRDRLGSQIKSVKAGCRDRLRLLTGTNYYRKLWDLVIKSGTPETRQWLEEECMKPLHACLVQVMLAIGTGQYACGLVQHDAHAQNWLVEQNDDGAEGRPGPGASVSLSAAPCLCFHDDVLQAAYDVPIAYGLVRPVDYGFASLWWRGKEESDAYAYVLSDAAVDFSAGRFRMVPVSNSSRHVAARGTTRSSPSLASIDMYRLIMSLRQTAPRIRALAKYCVTDRKDVKQYPHAYAVYSLLSDALIAIPRKQFVKFVKSREDFEQLVPGKIRAPRAWELDSVEQAGGGEKPVSLWANLRDFETSRESRDTVFTFLVSHVQSQQSILPFACPWYWLRGHGRHAFLRPFMAARGDAQSSKSHASYPVLVPSRAVYDLKTVLAAPLARCTGTRDEPRMTPEEYTAHVSKQFSMWRDYLAHFGRPYDAFREPRTKQTEESFVEERVESGKDGAEKSVSPSSGAAESVKIVSRSTTQGQAASSAVSVEAPSSAVFMSSTAASGAVGAAEETSRPDDKMLVWRVLDKAYELAFSRNRRLSGFDHDHPDIMALKFRGTCPLSLQRLDVAMRGVILSDVRTELGDSDKQRIDAIVDALFVGDRGDTLTASAYSFVLRVLNSDAYSGNGVLESVRQDLAMEGVPYIDHSRALVPGTSLSEKVARVQNDVISLLAHHSGLSPQGTEGGDMPEAWLRRIVVLTQSKVLPLLPSDLSTDLDGSAAQQANTNLTTLWQTSLTRLAQTKAALEECPESLRLLDTSTTCDVVKTWGSCFKTTVLPKDESPSGPAQRYPPLDSFAGTVPLATDMREYKTIVKGVAGAQRETWKSVWTRIVASVRP